VIRKVIEKLLLVVFGLVLALAPAEVALRLTPTYYWTNFVPSETLGWEFKHNLCLVTTQLGPGDVSLCTNSLGLRDTPEPQEIPQDAFLIAIQGDSTVAGFGLQPEETLPYQLQSYLRAYDADKKNYYVLNWGVSGYDPHQYILQAREMLQRYNVTLLIMVFNLGNDFGASALSNSYGIPRPYFSKSSGTLELVYPPRSTNEQVYAYKFIRDYEQYDSVLDPLNKANPCNAIEPDNIWSWSHLYTKVNKALCESLFYERIKHKFHQLFSASAVSPTETPESVAAITHLYSPNYGMWMYMEDPPEPYRSHRELVLDLIIEWQRQAPALIVLLPDKAQLSTELQKGFRSDAEALQLGALDFDLPTRSMLKLCQEAGVLVVDPLPVFRGVSDPDKFLYFPNDPHINGNANALLARRIGNVILSLDRP
jgi:hypothetical protein